jgi:hypothetical protein
MTNIQIRVLTNGAIFVQYQEQGKSKDAAFMTWPEFINWLSLQVNK